MTNVELAELIEIGLAQPEVDENDGHYAYRSLRTNRVQACVLGLAWIGKAIKESSNTPYGIVDEFNAKFYSEDGMGYDVIGKVLEIDATLARSLSHDHSIKSIPATDIAKQLKNGTYEVREFTY